jgi:DNA-binding CsgD family transcriptional regulator
MANRKRMSEHADVRTLLRLDGSRPERDVSHALLAPTEADTGRLAIRLLDTIMTAALVCDLRCRVVLANSAGHRLQRDGILQFAGGSGDPGIATLERAATRTLRRAIAEAAQLGAHPDSGGVVQVPRRAPQSFLLANVAPLAGDGSGTFAIVLIQDPLDADADIARQVREAFGATPAEARLGAALARGATRQEHAAATGVKASTIKTQLRGLFLKTDTRRETDLVRLLLSIPRLARGNTRSSRAAEIA